MAEADFQSRDQRPSHQSNSKYVEEDAAIDRSLKLLRDERVELTVRLAASGESLHCKVLDVTDADFLIEDIAPRSGLKALEDGVVCSMSGRAAGMFVYIEDVTVLRADAERGLPFFHVSRPDRLLIQQRRKAARFRLPMRISAHGASVTLFREPPVVGKLIDLSIGGCRVEFSEEIEFEADEEIEVCAITISDLLEVHSKGTVRHASVNRAKQTLVAGIELTEMHVTDRRRLEKFVQSIARQSDVA